MANTNDTNSNLYDDRTLFIGTGETESTAASLLGTSLVAISIPAGFTGTSMTFQVSLDGDVYQEYRSMVDGAAITAVVGADGAYASDASDFTAYNYIKVVVDAQAGDVLLTLRTKII